MVCRLFFLSVSGPLGRSKAELKVKRRWEE